MDDLVANLLVSIVLTAVTYMAFPLIRLAVNHGKFEGKRAKKIAFWNSIVVGAIFCIITIGASDGGSTWNAAPAVLYYFINRAVLTDKSTQEYKTPPSAANNPTSISTTPITTVPLEKTNTPHQTANTVCTPATKPILFCRKCGNKLIENSAFCNKCGTKVSTESAEK